MRRELNMVDALFLGVAVLTIVSAIAALEMRSLVYGGLALMGTLGGIAGFFLLLDSPFVALFQIAVYVGSIAVLILFTIMLVKRELIFHKKEDTKRRYAGIGLMLIIMISMGALIFNSGLSSITTDEPPVDYKEISNDFLTYYWPALIAMALVLSGSVTGAMILARRYDGVKNEQ
jgi:NADH:ubiquinone oxidoreductase subunit 6 (subunit J)